MKAKERKPQAKRSSVKYPRLRVAPVRRRLENGHTITELEILEDISKDETCVIARTVGHATDTFIYYANLFVLAPEMLEACQSVVDNWEHGDLAASARMCNAALIRAGKGEV